MGTRGAPWGLRGPQWACNRNRLPPFLKKKSLKNSTQNQLLVCTNSVSSLHKYKFHFTQIQFWPYTNPILTLNKSKFDSKHIKFSLYTNINLHYSIVWCCTLLYCTVQYNTVQCSTVYYTVLSCPILDSTVQYSTVLQWSTELHEYPQFQSILYVLYTTVLCTVEYCMCTLGGVRFFLVKT